MKINIELTLSMHQTYNLTNKVVSLAIKRLQLWSGFSLLWDVDILLFIVCVRGLKFPPKHLISFTKG